MKNRRNSPADFDLSRSDKFYKFSIPNYQIIAGVVYYEVTLRDLLNNLVYFTQFRFKEMKAIHETLLLKKVPPHSYSSNCPPSPKPISGARPIRTLS